MFGFPMSSSCFMAAGLETIARCRHKSIKYIDGILKVGRNEKVTGDGGRISCSKLNKHEKI